MPSDFSNDISIPRDPIDGGRHASFTRSYRARRPGMDRATKRLMLMAGALAAALVGGMGLWAVRPPRPVGVPTIEADLRPFRVKPDETVNATTAADPADDAPGASGMAPPAESPDPQALRAQLQAANPAPDARAAAPAATPSPAGPATLPAPPAPASTPSAATGQAVQLAALSSEAAATAEWTRLQKRAPDLLTARTPVVQRATVNGKPVWRLRTGGFPDLAEATQFCRKIRAKGLGCSLATF